MRTKDEIGNHYGKLTVVSFSHVKNENAHWLCICECGTVITTAGRNLRRGRSTSCGCQKGKHCKDEIGNRYGKLVVTNRAGSKFENAHWQCICDCGNTTIVSGSALRKENTKSCGCIKPRNPNSQWHKYKSNRIRKIKQNEEHTNHCESLVGRSFDNYKLLSYENHTFTAACECGKIATLTIDDLCKTKCDCYQPVTLNDFTVVLAESKAKQTLTEDLVFLIAEIFNQKSNATFQPDALQMVYVQALLQLKTIHSIECVLHLAEFTIKEVRSESLKAKYLPMIYGKHLLSEGLPIEIIDPIH